MDKVCFLWGKWCFCELTIDIEQLTIMVSLRDDSKYLVGKSGKYPENFQFHDNILFIPEGDFSTVNFKTKQKGLAAKESGEPKLILLLLPRSAGRF